MFSEYNCNDWVDDSLKELIANEIVYNEDIEELLYDDDWELFKITDFPESEVKKCLNSD